MSRYAVLGSPIEHSLSPALHNFLYRKLAVTAAYERFEVKQGELGNFLDKHRSNEWQGFSLTMPLKEEGLRHCESLAREAIETNSVNTLKREQNGWMGYNTDVFGFKFLLERISETSLAQVKNRSLAILGAGGTARAALVALRDSGWEIRVFRRSIERDQSLVRANPDIEIVDWSESSSAFDSSLLINCAPIDAMKSIPRVSSFTGVLFDSLYNPWPTPLMEVATANFFSGKDLLVAQAMRQFEIFFDCSLDYVPLFTELRALL
ncbi:MAG: shikimate dehydrogenase [Candidatus Nanopelagicaceae bacterium]|nr:shikimate dehydrogenase [Candidatus Nanopelagicaceae bacterium]